MQRLLSIAALMSVVITTLPAVNAAASSDLAGRPQTQPAAPTPSSSAIPEAVRGAFARSYPLVKKPVFLSASHQGEKAYIVGFRHDRKLLRATYSATGRLLDLGEPIAAEELPPLAIAAIRKSHPNGVVREAEKHVNVDGTLKGYSVIVSVDGKRGELALDAAGQIRLPRSEQSG